MLDLEIIVEILGFHAFVSFLKNFARSKDSSLIKVSIVCLSPIRIRGTSTITLKKALGAIAFYQVREYGSKPLEAGKQDG